MKLKKLLKDLPIKLYRGSQEVEIRGLSSHSKLVAPGFLFIAKKGSNDDGAAYIKEAISNGSVCILSEEGDPFLKEVVQVVTSRVREVEAVLAERFYENPSSELTLVGITGTSGKTTISYLIKHFFDLLEMPCGLIGTIEAIIGNYRYPPKLTTADVITNQKMLRDMCKQGCTAAVMEVSSHGLEQKRVDRLLFDTAIFTNLSHDHLDYHQTMEAYADAKALLFSSLSSSQRAVVNYDSPWSKRVTLHCKAPIYTFGFSPEADLYAHEIKLSLAGSSFLVTYRGETQPFSWKHIGRHNIANALAALLTMAIRGVSLSKLSALLSTFPMVPGRLERLGNHPIFVDYAHKPDALEKVLGSLQELKKGKIVTLFGCGGDRDKAKRPVMAAIAERLSDWVVVTSDNPRSEDPDQIAREIVAGFSGKNFSVELDRKKAIALAITLAKREDLILIAGKGHETYQIFAHQTLPFDDRKIAAELIR